VKLHKRILNLDWVQSIITGLAAAYLRFVRLSGHWEMRDWHNIQDIVDQGKPVVLCFWHGRLLAKVFGWPKDAIPLHQLSTAHRDGKLAGKTYQRLGLVPVWLDSKSPTEATRKIVKILKNGGVCSLTPDGPKGPRQRMQMSAIDLARLGGAYLVPVSSSGSRMKILNTWDKMQVPLPFSRGAFQMGQAIEVPRKATKDELESIRKHMEDSLNDITRTLDTEFGQETPEPGSEPTAITPPKDAL